MLIKVANAFEMTHGKGVGKTYMVPQTDLEKVASDKIAMTEGDDDWDADL